MAKNAKYYAKISGSWEQQYFESTAAQITYPNQGAGLLNNKTTVDAALDEIHAKFGANSGFATLTASGKLTASQVPDFVFGGLKFKSTASAGSLAAVASLLDSAFLSFGDPNSGLEVKGVEGTYFIASSDFSLSFIDTSGTAPFSQQAGSTGRYYFWKLATNDPGEEDGVSSNSIDIEAGDWVVITRAGFTSNESGSASNPYVFEIGIINNTYDTATSSRSGIVQLSSASAWSGTGGLADNNNVITEEVLQDVIVDNFVASGGDNGSATTFARGDHDHDSTYLQLAGGTLTGDLTLQYGQSVIMDVANNNSGATAGSNTIDFKYRPVISNPLATKTMSVDSGGDLLFGSDKVLHETNWSSYVPKVTVSTGNASGGKDGDVWIKYSSI